MPLRRLYHKFQRRRTSQGGGKDTATVETLPRTSNLVVGAGELNYFLRSKNAVMVMQENCGVKEPVPQRFSKKRGYF